MNTVSTGDQQESTAAVGIDARYARRAAVSSLVGSTIEWYDFFLYGTAAALVFSAAFFAPLPESWQQLMSYLTLAIGFAARPIGGMLFGHFGDRLGRKSTLIVSLMLMGGTTVAIGLLPTHAQIGLWAPILLVICRLLQGIAIGGEWGGAVLLAVEAAPPEKRRFYGSFPQIGTPLGLILGNVVVLIVSNLMSDQAFLSWGWRLPFVASVVLLGVGLFIRSRVPETPAFVKAQQQAPEQEEVPLLRVLKNYPKQVLLGICVLVGHSATTYIVLTFSLGYGTTRLGFTRSQVLTGVLIVGVLWAISIPVWGRMADRSGLRRLFLIGTITLLVAMPLYLPLLGLRSVPALIVASVLLGVILPIAHTGQGSILADLFPTRVSYSGTSLSYQLGALLGGGLAPFMASWLMLVTGRVWPVTAYVVVLLLLTLVTIPAIARAAAAGREQTDAGN